MDGIVEKQAALHYKRGGNRDLGDPAGRVPGNDYIPRGLYNGIGRPGMGRRGGGGTGLQTAASGLPEWN